MAQLALEDLSKSFGQFAALRGVSMIIEAGEFICLLGPSGCGKTTLLRIIAGLETPDSGDLKQDGKSVTSVPCHRRNVGMVFQSLALFPHLNVGENVTYGMRLRGASVADREIEAARLLALVGLTGLGGRRISELSGGQQQRVAIARAIALKPDFFLMDEPFSALDAGLREQMQMELRSLQRRLEVTTIFVTHDQREAMALADRIVVMEQGQIEQVGSPDEIYSRPASRYVAEFIGTNNLIDLTVGSEAIMIGNQKVAGAASALDGALGSVTIAVRPEDIRLERKGGMADGKLVGRVNRCRRLGSTAEVEVMFDGGTIMHRCLRREIANISEGEEVTVSWDWSAAWVVPR